MNVNLTKIDVIRMIRGTNPLIADLEKLSKLGLFSLQDCDWYPEYDRVWISKTIEELWELYRKIDLHQI